jgi:hypothetical protein
MPPRDISGTTETQNKFEDLSGVNTSAYENPYDALIEACENDSVILLPCHTPTLSDNS